ncbi:MAG: UBP-type zinc finger domain-containing protein [Mycobacterium sp.]
MTASVDPSVPPSGTGCVECEAAGGWWVHLRRCAACGHIGCCDDSLSRHAAAHWRSSEHESKPADETVPGPRGRVPGDWMQQLQNRA